MNWKLQAALTVAVALALALLGVGLVWATLSPEQAAQVGALLKGVWPVALLALLPLVGLSVWFWRGHDHQHAQGPDRLMEKVKLLSAAAQSQQLDVRSESPALQRLGALVLAFGAVGRALAATIVGVRVWPAEDYTRVTLESDTPLSAKHFMMANPNRLVIDIDGLALSPQLRELVSKVRADDPYIAGVRVGRIDGELASLATTLEESQANAREARARLEQAVAKMGDLESERQALDAQRRTLGEQRDAARNNAREAREAAHQLALSLESQRARVVALSQSLARMGSQKAQL